MQDDNLEFRTYIDEAAARSKELRRVIVRIVELRPHDKSIQKVDDIVDVLVVKLSTAAIRATDTPRSRLAISLIDGHRSLGDRSH
jgi:hypothetical protein